MTTTTLPPPLTAADNVDGALAQRGFAVIGADELNLLLGSLPGVAERALKSWSAYWGRLAHDQHLRDGGRYRQRRHGSFIVEGASATPAPHRAHWQPVEYNALHGGIERWFQPLETAFVAEPLWQRLLALLGERASALCGGTTRTWYTEAHQFRIDTAGGIGRPTPEGAHRDGVDLVAVMLIDRSGVKGGETRVFDAAGPSGQRFTMTEPGQMLLLDDARTIHETTPIQPLDANRVGHRDTLVVTLRAGAFQGP
jgi:hypothetical protein